MDEEQRDRVLLTRHGKPARSIRELRRLRKAYGPGRWRKVKGLATIQLRNGIIWEAELHWYEAHGIDRKEFKIKKLLPTL